MSLRHTLHLKSCILTIHSKWYIIVHMLYTRTRAFAACFACVAFLLPVTVLASIHALDLRPKAVTRPLLRTAAATDGILQSTSLSAGTTDTTPLALGDELTFLLFDGIEITIRVTERTESPLGGESFLGEVSGYDGVKNAVVLQTEEGLTVDIQDFANSRVYTIVSTASGVTVNEIDPSLNTITPTAPIDPGLPSKNRALLSATALGSTPDQASTLVDVLVAYDTPAAAWARQNGGGITNFATMAVQKMNTVLENCGLSSNFRYRLVGVMTVAAEGGADFDGVLATTRSGTGAWAPIKAKRDEVGADIVSTFIDTGSASGTTGLGYSLSSTPISSFSESAYNVCAVRAVSSSHTMTHEVGHNIGAGHATAVNSSEITPGPQLYNYSAGYYFTGTDNVAYHTIMAYNFDGYGNHYSPAPFFSSPNFTYQGTAVGDATHDNVRTIQQTYSAASQWRTQKVPMSYDVYFSPESGATFTDSITVTLTPGKVGLSIRYTLDGSTPNVSSTLYTAPITLTQTTTIRAVTVTDGVAGPVFEATYSVSDLGNGVDAPQLSWRTSDTQPWFFQTSDTWDGIDAVQSMDKGLYSNNEYDLYWNNESWLETTVTGPTHMSFRYKTRKHYGTFTVLVDGTAALTDTTDVSDDIWHLQEISIPQGSHFVKFLFQCWIDIGGGSLQGGRYNGFNGVWLDTVQFDALSRPPTISPETTADESTAYTFQGSQTVTLTPPAGKQGVLYYTTDGSDPTGETQHLYEGPITLTKSTRVRAVFVEGGKEPSAEVGGLYLERHPVQPGEWTTDVEGAKSAAAQDGRLIAVLLADIKTCSWCQRFDPIAESPEFLSWANANGIYLVTADVSRYADAQTAYSWFWDLCEAYTGERSSGYPQMYFVRPASPNTPIAQGLARNDGSSVIGTKLYLDTAESLIAGFASVLGSTVPQAPVCSHTDSLVDSFPITVTLTNPNGSGTMYYTLDGSVPSSSNGSVYSGAITLSDSSKILTAIIWPASGLSSGAYVSHFKTVGDVLGTSGIAWSRSGAVKWREVKNANTLRAGGLMNSSYTATLQGVVTGKGKLVFKYEFNSYSYQNSFEFKKNESRQFRYAYDGTLSRSGIVTNEVSSDITTTFEWIVTVDAPDYDYDDRYTAPSGAWLSNVQWIPEVQAVEIEGVSVPYTWLDGTYPGQGGSSTAYETLAISDTDGDGFLAWQEYLLGTDPKDADSRLFATVRMVDGSPVFGWSHTNVNINAQGFRYVPKGRTSLDDTAGWQPYSSGHRFFKVAIEPIE